MILPKLFNVTVGAPGSAGCGAAPKNGKQQELRYGHRGPKRGFGVKGVTP